MDASLEVNGGSNVIGAAAEHQSEDADRMTDRCQNVSLVALFFIQR